MNPNYHRPRPVHMVAGDDIFCQRNVPRVTPGPVEDQTTFRLSRDWNHVTCGYCVGGLRRGESLGT